MKTTKLLTIVTMTIALGFLAVATTWAQTLPNPETETTNPYLWQPSVESVSVFKNGLGFFTRRAKVDLRDGWCCSGQIPPAAFGTLAIYSLNEKHLVDIVGSGKGEIVDFDNKDAPKDINNKRSRLDSNKYLKVELSYMHDGAAKTAAGKIISVGPEFVVLESQNNSFAVPIAGITRMQLLEQSIRTHVKSENGDAPQNTDLGMAYLRKGITWIPEYTLKILDENTAELTLRGTLVNEAEDLIHCDVNFVVGVPHFVHTDYLSPIAVGQIIRTICAATVPTQIGSQIMNRAAIASNSIGSNQFADGPEVYEQMVNNQGDLDKALGNLPQMESAAGTDYTVYTKKDMTLRQGEKAIVTLFIKEISYGHIYRWTPPERLKHLLVLKNSTDTTWTTGPCLTISDGRPLSEDLLKYTPKEGKCEIPVTDAINIAHDKSEKEIEREFQARKIDSSSFLDLVTLQGTLKLHNFEKKDAELVITVSVPGKPTEASDDGSSLTDATKLELTKRAGSINWNITLKAGEAKIITYEYQRYVHSG